MKTPIAAFFALSLTALVHASSPWDGLDFLKGSWIAKAKGPNDVVTAGTYTFQSELDNHVMARYSTRDGNCKAPANFDCEHGDSLFIYEDAPGQALKAIYFDNEGHVIHYDVSTPAPGVAVFLSEPSGKGPVFRLRYELHGSEMSGRFEMQLPGRSDWKSYLEWTGPRK
jgi:hypothetical protein